MEFSGCGEETHDVRYCRFCRRRAGALPNNPIRVKRGVAVLRDSLSLDAMVHLGLVIVAGLAGGAVLVHFVPGCVIPVVIGMSVTGIAIFARLFNRRQTVVLLNKRVFVDSFVQAFTEGRRFRCRLDEIACIASERFLYRVREDGKLRAKVEAGAVWLELRDGKMHPLGSGSARLAEYHARELSRLTGVERREVPPDQSPDAHLTHDAEAGGR